MSGSRSRLVAIMGPTASGKTALAVDLVRRLPLDIVSVDSAQVYRGLEVGSAKPDAETRRLAPHRLIDIRDPWETYSAASFVDDAVEACRSIWSEGRTPLLVGGTMLYFQALEKGLSPLPPADASLRDDIEAEALRRGWPALHAELAAVDPVAAERIHANDPQRIQRALEVYRSTGKPLSALQDQAVAPLDCDWLKLIVCPEDRAELHRRIELRFAQMLEQGLVDEVRELMADPRLHPDLPSMRAVGYRQVWQHLEGAFDEAELALRGVYATRQLAKRQITWLRRQQHAIWIDPCQPDWIAKGLSPIAQFLDTSL